MENIKNKILQKKELKGLKENFLNEFLEEYKIKHEKEFKILEEKKFNEKSKEFELLKKYIRKKLREVHGVFTKKNLNSNKKKKLLKLIKNAEREAEQNTIQEILSAHQSTFERIPHYEELYFKLFEKNKPKKILDLGCGYNPFSYFFIKKIGAQPEYVAVDINNEDEQFIKEYFLTKKINGSTKILDLTEEENLKEIETESKNSDFCFLFKLLDSLESKKKGSSEKLLNHLNSKELVISFPLKTIGGKNKIKGKRRWFEKILKKDKYICSELNIGPEKYYILKPKIKENT